MIGVGKTLALHLLPKNNYRDHQKASEEEAGRRVLALQSYSLLGYNWIMSCFLWTALTYPREVPRLLPATSIGAHTSF